MNYKSDLIIKYVSCETKMFCFTNVCFFNVYKCVYFFLFVSCETLDLK